MPSKTNNPDADILADLGVRAAKVTPEVVAGAADDATRTELAQVTAAIGLITTGRPRLAARVRKARADLDDLTAQLDRMDDAIEKVAPKWKRVRA